jgi:hypothetical protein
MRHRILQLMCATHARVWETFVRKATPREEQLRGLREDKAEADSFFRQILSGGHGPTCMLSAIGC